MATGWPKIAKATFLKPVFTLSKTVAVIEFAYTLTSDLLI